VEGATPTTGVRGCTLEDILEIMVVVFIETTKLPLLGTLQLSCYVAVLSTVVRLDGQTAIGPQLPLGTKSMRGLD
jgi:hypothetical protein